VSALPTRLPKKDLMGGRGKKAGAGGKTGPVRHRKQGRYPPNLHGYLQGITSPVLRRIARRAGVKRICKTFYDTARNHMLHNLAEIVRSTISYTACAKRSTIFTKDVIFAAGRLGQKLVGMK
jgi:histone H4